MQKKYKLCIFHFKSHMYAQIMLRDTLYNIFICQAIPTSYIFVKHL